MIRTGSPARADGEERNQDHPEDDRHHLHQAAQDVAQHQHSNRAPLEDGPGPAVAGRDLRRSRRATRRPTRRAATTSPWSGCASP